MIRIAYIITKAEWAGAQRVVYELCDAFGNRDGFETVLLVGGEGLLAERVREMGIRVRVCDHLRWKINPVEDMLGLVELYKMIGDGGFDVVHCHSTKAGMLGRIAARLAGVPRIVYTVHGWWPVMRFERRLVRRAVILAERLLANISTDMVYLTRADEGMARAWGIGKRARPRLIQNGIRMRENVRPALRRELGIGPGELVVGNVARVCGQKKPDEFLDIASEMAKRRKDIRFVWIGDGPDLERIRARIEDEGIEGCDFIGFRENVVDYMSEFDLLLLTSDVEGMPISLLEARLLGVPILAKEADGLREHLDPCFMERELTPDAVGIHLQRGLCRGVDDREHRRYEAFVEEHLKMYAERS